MQRVGHDPRTRLGENSVIVQIVDVIAARVHGHPGNLGDHVGERDRELEVGRQVVDDVDVHIHGLEYAAHLVKDLARTDIAIEQADLPAGHARYFLPGSAACNRAAVAQGKLVFIRIGWRQRVGVGPEGQRIEADSSIGGDRRLIQRIGEKNVTGTIGESGQPEFFEIAGPVWPPKGIGLEQGQEHVIHDLRPVKHVDRNRRRNQGGTDAQNLTEDIPDGIDQFLRVFGQRQRLTGISCPGVANRRDIGFRRQEEGGNVLSAIEVRRGTNDSIGEILVIQKLQHVDKFGARRSCTTVGNGLRYRRIGVGFLVGDKEQGVDRKNFRALAGANQRALVKPLVTRLFDTGVPGDGREVGIQIDRGIASVIEITDVAVIDTLAG